MDIAGLSMAMHQSQLQEQVSVSVMKMTMENTTAMNNQMTDMMDNMAVDSNLGSRLNALA